MRRCVGMGGGALLGDFVGGGAGAASFAIRAAMAEALPEDLGVFAAAFSFLAASSLAFALAIISATPILHDGAPRSWGTSPFYGFEWRRRSCAAELLGSTGHALMAFSCLTHWLIFHTGVDPEVTGP